MDVPGTKADEVSFKVSFSDGKAHGGIENGSVVAVKPGKTGKIDGIPSGVLVTAIPQTEIDGYATPGKQKVEVGLKNKRMGFSYKADGALRTANL